VNSSGPDDTREELKALHKTWEAKHVDGTWTRDDQTAFLREMTLLEELRREAYEASQVELANAWRGGSPEFATALDLAMLFENDGPLLEYLYSEKPLGHADRQNLVAYIEWLKARAAPKRPAGRPKRSSENEDVVVTAEKWIAGYVASHAAEWRKQHDRERVPAAETDRWIVEGIERVRQFGLHDQTVRKIRRDNIRNALKSGRIVVP
jgi:hypothetical protein